MPVITIDFFKGRRPINGGLTPVDVKTNAFFMLDGFKTENVMTESVVKPISVVEPSALSSPTSQEAEQARVTNAEALNYYNPTPEPLKMEEAQVNSNMGDIATPPMNDNDLYILLERMTKELYDIQDRMDIVIQEVSATLDKVKGMINTPKNLNIEEQTNQTGMQM